MQINPANSNFSPTPQIPQTFWETIKMNIGRAWKRLYQLPQEMHKLIATITNVGKKINTTHELKNLEIKRSEQPSKKNAVHHFTLRRGWLYPRQRKIPSSSKLKRQEPKKNPLEKMKVNAPALERSLVIEKSLNKLVKDQLKPAFDLLEEVNESKPTTLQDYLDFNNRIAEQYDFLLSEITPFFMKHYSAEAQEITQKTIIALKDMMIDLHKDLCADVRRLYKPNEVISNDGNCIFSSINYLLGSQASVGHFRKRAANYIRKHTEDFPLDFKNMMNLPEKPRAQLNEYAKLQGGWKIWRKKLKETLERKPKFIDFYTDCMENYKLWGGHMEIKALANMLKIPILVFAEKDSVSWKLDLEVDQSIYARAILLYNNGDSYYQTLMARD